MANGTLAQADQIGGVYVTVAADLSPLRAGVADAKRITMSAGRELKMVAPIAVDLRAYEQQVRQVSQINQRMWNERIQQARISGEREGEAEAQGRERAYRRYMGTMGGGGGGGRARRGGGRIRQLDDVFENFLPGTFNAAFKIGGAIAVARAMGGAVNLAADAVEVGPREAFGGLVRSADSLIGGMGSGLNRFQESAFGGSLGGGLRNAINFYRSADNKILTDDQEAAAKRDEARGVRQMEQAQRTAQVNQQASAITMQFRADRIGGFYGAAQGQLDAFNAAAGAAQTTQVIAARTALEQNVKRAQGFDAQRIGAAQERFDIAGLSVMASQLGRAGEGTAAFALSQRVARRQLENTQAERFIGVNGSRDRALIAQGNRAETLLFDEQQAQQRADRAKAINASIASATASEQQSTLRISKQYYAADLQAFDAAAKAKIDAIEDVEEKEREARRQTAQRNVIVAQQQEQIGLTNRGFAAAGRIALLSANGSNFQADREAFDEETAQTRPGIDAANLKAFDERRRQEREALLTRQRRTKQRIGSDVNNRIASAGARGEGNDALAGVIQTIGGIQQEIADADPEVRGQIQRAGVAELQSLRQRMFGPSRTADSLFDPTRESTGSRGGDDEGLKVLKLIHEALKQLVEKNPGGLPS